MAPEPSPEPKLDTVGDARKRGAFALFGTAVVCLLAFGATRACIDPPGEPVCNTNADCQGVVGVECLHAPTGTYCTHTCREDSDCEPQFHCDSPPWEKGATRSLCLKNVASPQ